MQRRAGLATGFSHSAKADETIALHTGEWAHLPWAQEGVSALEDQQ